MTVTAGFPQVERPELPMRKIPLGQWSKENKTKIFYSDAALQHCLWYGGLGIYCLHCPMVWWHGYILSTLPLVWWNLALYMYIIYVGWAYTLSTLPVIWWVGHTYSDILSTLPVVWWIRHTYYLHCVWYDGLGICYLCCRWYGGLVSPWTTSEIFMAPDTTM